MLIRLHRQKQILQSILVLLFLTSIGNNKLAQASHLMGGEITWECISSGSNAGRFIFQLKLYRYCAGAGLQNFAQINNPLYSNWGGPSVINLSLISTADLSINCGDSLLAMDCSDPNRNQYSIEEFVYTSSPIMLYGVPGTYPTGSEFGYSICCRPATVININAITNANYYIRSKMFRYVNPLTGAPDTLGTSNNASCYDSSPIFAQRPSITLCSNNPYHYSHNAFDPDVDSLSYSWGAPMSAWNNFSNWNTGYSNTSQFPNTSHHANNIPATLDPVSGEIYFKIFSPAGLYSTVIKATTYRAGQPIAETFRDIALSIVNCTYTNLPPVVDFKACPSCPSYPSPAIDTVYAGDTVNLIVQSTDIGFLPGGFPQKNFLNPTSLQFGERYGSTSIGCLNPPCATMDTNSIFYSTPSNNWSGVLGLSTTFKWTTDCAHLPAVNGYYVQSSNHSFVFNVIDNYCPIPASDSRSFTITVKAPPDLPAPRFLCTEILSDSLIMVNWNVPVSSADDTLNSFRYYVIYRSVSPTGPYVIVDSIDDIDTHTYLDSNVNIQNNDYYYFIKGLSSCHSQSQKIASDTIAAIHLEGEVINNGSKVNLQWLPFGLDNEFPYSAVAKYKVWQIKGGDTTLVGDQTSTNLSLDYFECYPENVSYQIEVYDTTKYWSCTSRSNLLSLLVGDSLSPNVQMIDSVSVLQNGLAILGWTPIIEPDHYENYVSNCDSVILTSLEPSVSFYIDSVNGSVNSIRLYALASSDTCLNSNFKKRSLDCQSSIFLNVEFNKCTKSIELNWNPYNTFRSGLDVEYKIYSKDSSGDFKVIGKTMNSSYSFSDLEDGIEYCLFVQAWENKGNGPFSSSSNQTCVWVDLLEEAEFLYVDYASVLNNEFVELCLRTDVSDDLKGLSILRAQQKDTLFSEIWNYNFTNPIDPNDTIQCFTDSSADVANNSYSYKIGLLDVCDSLVGISNIGKSIHLNVKWDKMALEHVLEWNEYEDWLSGVETYIIYKGKNEGDFTEFDRVDFYSDKIERRKGQITYRYKLGSNDNDQINYCYKIVAIEKEKYFRRNFAVSSVSNIDCIHNRPMFYAPNSFTPNGDDINESFKVIGATEGISHFNIKLFNRWGQMVFESSDPNIGWDGLFEGKQSPSDSYVYRIEYRLGEHDPETETIMGSFNLLR